MNKFALADRSSFLMLDIFNSSFRPIKFFIHIMLFIKFQQFFISFENIKANQRL